MALTLEEGISIGLKLSALVKNTIDTVNALPVGTKKLVEIVTFIKVIIPPLCDLIVEAVGEAED